MYDQLSTAVATPKKSNSAAKLAAERRVVLQACSDELRRVQQSCVSLQTDMQQAQLAQGLFTARPSMQMLGDVGEALASLTATTERFALVIDLTVAAVDYLDATTFRTAQACVEEHVRGCVQQLAAVRTALADYPLLDEVEQSRRLS